MVGNELRNEVAALRRAAAVLAASDDRTRQRALFLMAAAILSSREEIRRANDEDIAKAKEDGISPSLLHRLEFTDEKAATAVKGVRELAMLPDPIGRTLVKRELDLSFVLEKRTFPIGVIAMIFEARPDALVQMAGLCLRSGNTVVLKGGREALNTNRVLCRIILEATAEAVGCAWLLGIENRADVDALLSMEGLIDLIIPRGSNSFVRHVMDNTRIPVLGHADGICSVFIDESADLDMAVRISVDAKCQYPAACNAAETFLVHEAIAARFLPMLADAFRQRGVRMHCTDEVLRYIPDGIRATEMDFDTEYLALECAIRTVSSIDEAISHIARHSSHHTDAIITSSMENRDRFFSLVDSADVFCNASTRFSDGFRFGLGAEVGISTSKIHARGPVGLEGLMTTKWLLSGSGETVAEYSGAGGRAFHHKDLI